jgi:hypothetical protein
MRIAKGSSREVLKSSPKYINLDGTLTEIKIVIKSRITNNFDQYLIGDSFGLQQNKFECNAINNDYSILLKNKTGGYSTNELGCLAPVFEYDVNYDWLEMGYVAPIGAWAFNQLTITPDYPDGLNFDCFVYCANKKYRELYGSNYPDDTLFPGQISDIEYEQVLKHPWVNNFISWMQLVQFEANDLILKNMGIFWHPITDKGYPVICDYGINREYWQKISELRDEYDSITRNN